MTYSKDALNLRMPKIVELPRAGDRISFLHLDRCRIVQTETGVAALLDDGAVFDVPVASLSVLTLGGGSSITTPAIGTLSRAGCSIMVSYAGGVSAVATARPLAQRSHWAEAQARMWSVHEHRIKAAKTMYRLRFPHVDWTDADGLDAMRGMEGFQVKLEYKRQASRHHVRSWRRDTTSDDDVNQLLNLANGILYAASLAAVSAVAMNPALGIIHQGSVKALLLDLADHHKVTSSIPIAFKCGGSDDGGGSGRLRKEMRNYLHKKNVIPSMLLLMDEILSPHFDHKADEDTLLDETTDAPGHKNYANTKPETNNEGS